MLFKHLFMYASKISSTSCFTESSRVLELALNAVMKFEISLLPDKW